MNLNPYFAVVLAAAIWGSAGVFIKYLNLPPATITFFRFAVPAVILLAVFVYQKRPVFRGARRMIFVGSLANILKTFFYFLGFTLASVGNAITVYFIWPLITAALGGALLKEKISKRNIFLFAVAFTGICLIYSDKNFSFSDRDFLGMSAMFVSALATAIFMVAFKKISASYSKYEMIFHQNALGAVVFFPFLFFNSSVPSTSQLITVVFYALLVGIIGFVLLFSAMKKIKISTVSFLAYFEPVSAIIFAAVLLGERLSANTLAGGALIVTAAMMLEKN